MNAINIRNKILPSPLLMLAHFFPHLLSLAVVGTLAMPAHAAGQVLDSEHGQVKVVEVASGLDTPWALAFLPDGRILLTERPGRMRLLDTDGTLSPALAGVPRVFAHGQAGLLDVVLSPQHADDQLIYFSFVEPTANGARTAVARARLDAEVGRLEAVTVIFRQNEDPPGNHHWGSRLVFDRQGQLFVTLGDRFHHRQRAQALDSELGKIVRIATDGSVPADNPFVANPPVTNSTTARPTIWSWGHRNVQGAALHPQSGELWAHEHGPQGGDELNVVRGGRNYGWPEITFGREYITGFRIGSGSERADVEAPRWQWTPSIAPSGMSFYTGKRFPAWQGNLFVGALKYQLLVRLELDGERVVHEERLPLGKRIRDVRQGPDGHLWLLDESDGRVLRLEPAVTAQ